MTQYCPQTLVQSLDQAGLNMLAVMPASVLPETVSQAFSLNPATSSVLLIANQGPSMWQKLNRRAAESGIRTSDPVDDYVLDTVLEHGRAVLPDQHLSVLYPRTRLDSSLPHVPLQKLGTVAGWHHASPMGIGIHPEFGLWFAYRALVCVDMVFTPGVCVSGRWSALRESGSQVVDNTSESVCDTCETRACQSACPAGAVTFGQLPDMARCSTFRLSENSPCASQCLARNACPVGGQSRYESEQTAHHYSLSLASLRDRIR